MVRQLSDFFKSNFFDKSFSLEYRVCMVFFFEICLLSLLFALYGTFLERDYLGSAVPWGFIALYTIIIVLPLKIRLALEKPLVLFLAFVSIPLLYFQIANEGVAALLFSVLGIFTLAIIFKGIQRTLLILLNIAMCVACVVERYLMLESVEPFATDSHSLILLIGVFLVASGGLAVLTAYVSNAFGFERTATRALTQELETCKESLAELTGKDELTELYGKRFLYQHLPREIDIAKRTDQSLCLLMIDIDNFQQINEVHGHALGNHLLKQIIHVIQTSLRTYDIVARLDDMKFVVVLHHTRFASAFNIAERIRAGVQNLTFDQEIKITLSIGLTESQEKDTINTIIERVDDYLNRAINEGRDQIVGGE